jgi:CBS domain containing-hemolysin-like protein
MAVLEVLLLIVLISINAFFVAAEMAFVRTRHTRIDQLAEEGNRAARLAQAALNDPDRFISACQLGITMTTLILGDVGEQTFAADISDAVLAFGLPHILSVGLLHAAKVACYFIAFAATAFLQTVFGELIPKTWTYSRAETVLLVLIWPIRAWQWVSAPFLFLLNRVTSFVLGLLRVKEPPRHQVVYSEEEIKRLVSDSQQVGVLEQGEEQMIHSVFDFSDTKVEEVMTPRTSMICINGDRSIREFIDLSLQHGFSRIPLFDKDMDKIFGMAHIRDGLSALLKGKETSSVRELSRKVLIVPQNKEVSDLLAELRLTKTQMAIVVDEYGGTRGLVTIEDLVEELVGDISDEYDVVHDHISVQQDGSFIVDGGMSLYDFSERMKVNIEDEEFNTLGGHLFGVLGRAPHVGDEIEEYGCVFRIEEIDRARILKLKLTRKPTGEVTEAAGVVRVAPARKVRKPNQTETTLEPTV